MKLNALSTREVDVIVKAAKPGRTCDGRGLNLEISKFGTASWVFIYQHGGHKREMGLGSARTISLKVARALVLEQHEILQRGDDPIEVRLAKRDYARIQKSERITFKDAAEKYLAIHNETWTNDKHRAQWHTTLRKHAYPTLGPRPVVAIDGALITEALSPIWMKTPETARRVKQRIEMVLDWVKNGMPLPQKTAKIVKHHAAVAVDHIPSFMAELRKRDGYPARALEFIALTAARQNEALGAKWGEIDFDKGTWTVPASRMKKRREHIVPLPKRAVEILENLPRQGDFIFPGASGDRPLDGSTVWMLLKEIRGNGDTVHGFRSSFRDWAGDRTNHSHETIEFALAHSIPDRTAAAYRRYTALPKRRALMDSWAQFCGDSQTGVATVTQLRRA
jgi:integrase